MSSPSSWGPTVPARRRVARPGRMERAKAAALSLAREGGYDAVTMPRVAAVSGRFDAAHDLYQRGAQAALRENLPELAAQWTLEDAETTRAVALVHRPDRDGAERAAGRRRETEHGGSE